MSELSNDWDVPPDWWVIPDKAEGGWSADRTAEAPQDPYFWWFLLSGPLSMLDDRGWPQRIYFSVERVTPPNPALESEVCKAFHLSIPPAYQDRRFLTLSMNVRSLRNASLEDWKKKGRRTDAVGLEDFAASFARQILSLQYAKCFHRLVMGVPIESSVEPRPLPSRKNASPLKGEAGRPGQDVVLGLIDDGLPYLHAALRDQKGSSRMVSIWDQRWSMSSAHPVFGGVPSFGYGAVSVSCEITASIKKLSQGTSTEASEYAQHGFTDMRRRNSHGAAVLQLLAGDSSVCGPSAPSRWPAKQTSVLPVIGVQIPFRHSSRRSLAGWLAVHVIDGMNFIAEQAKAFSPKHLFVNLSLGAYGGPHDGTAIVDGAMDELVKKSAPTQITPIAATGNTAGTRRNPSNWRGPRLPSGIHATGTWKEDQPLTFTLRVPPDKAEDTFLEIWFDRELPPRSPIKVSLAGPDGRTIVQEGFFSRLSAVSKKETRFKNHGILFFRKVSQSRAKVNKKVLWRSMVLIALAPTRGPAKGGGRSVPAGDWTVTLAFDSSIEPIKGQVVPVPDCRVDAWVERDDTWVGSRRGQQARLVNAHGEQAAVTDENTFTSLAHCNSVTSAGAIDGTTREASPYSAEHKPGGVTRYSAVADRSPLRRGVLVGGTHSGTMRFATGTSMAAPQVTRSLANMAAAAPKPPKPPVEPGVSTNRQERTAKKGLELP